jgi:trimethylamine--corrinoid protein Co-methyltransferase
VGILVRNEEARDRFARHGCQVAAGVDVVKFPRSVVEQFRAPCPPTFTFNGRDPQYDRTIPGDGPLLVTGSSAPDIVDLVTGEVRRAQSQDIARIAYLVNELPGYDLFGISVTADDAPPGRFHLSRFYPALKNCLKPVRGSAPSLDEAEKILRMCTEIAGSKERVLGTTFCDLPVLPGCLAADHGRRIHREADAIYRAGNPQLRGSHPERRHDRAPIADGAIVLCNAEFLAQITLEQMSRPGKPLVYDAVLTVTDVRTGAYGPGGIETGILAMGCAQMARFYNVPSGGFAGLTNAKVNDAQAGFEMGMSSLAALLAGVDLITVRCLLDGLLVFDYATLAISAEIALMVKRVARDLEFDEENLAAKAITEVGPGGLLLDTAHTLERMRSTALLPEIADRSPRSQWQANGAQDAHSRPCGAFAKS